MEQQIEETTLAQQLESAIKLGNYLTVQHLLQAVRKVEDVQSVENQFSAGDPVILAIDCREEEIAWYLIEKGFSYKNIYKYPDIQCDEWCNADHGPSKCPVEYDASDLAKIRGLHKVTEVIDQLNKGQRKPGDGLSSQQGLNTENKISMVENQKKTRGMIGSLANGTPSPGQQAKARFDELWKRHESRGCKAMILDCIDEHPRLVFLCAAAGVPINHQNAAGLTALHLAVKYGKIDIAEALLMCGADLSLRNQYGQTPTDMANDDECRTLLERFRPGLPSAVSKGDSAAVIRLFRLWCNPFSNIKNGKSALELCEAGKANIGVAKCLNLLKQHSKTMELQQAVLREDIDTLKKVLRTEVGWNINVRYRDQKGRTPLSCALDQKNLEITQLLLDTGKVQLDIRVRETERAEETVPIIYKALHTDCPIEIWRCLSKHFKQNMLLEKDSNGNTAVLRAIEEGRDAKFLEIMIREASGHCLIERNKHCLTLREMALQKGRQDIVSVIDKYVTESVGKYFLMSLPVNFYGQELLDVENEAGISLKDLALERGFEDDIQAVDNYGNIELYARKLFRAAATGDIKRVKKYNKANYRDKNGYTALTRAIAFEQLLVAEELITQRPALKTIPDNCNRYPLHYAYCLPGECGKAFVNLLLQNKPEDVERLCDMHGLMPSEYQGNDTHEIHEIIQDARTLDAYGNVGFLQCLPETDSINILSLTDTPSEAAHEQ